MAVAAILILLLALPADCDQADVPLAEAAAAFQQGLQLLPHPEAAEPLHLAAELYGRLRDCGYDNAGIARNEGNAALMAGDLPRAILAYRHGLRLAPGDAELRAGLAYARLQVVYPTPDDYGRPPVERWPAWLPRPSLGVWLALAVAAYVATCVVFTRWLMTRRLSFLRAAVPCLVATISCTIALAAEDAGLRDRAAHRVVVVSGDDVRLRKGNGLSYLPRRDTPLARGAEARLLFERGGWLQVQLAGGEIGWLPRGDILLEEP